MGLQSLETISQSDVCLYIENLARPYAEFRVGLLSRIYNISDIKNSYIFRFRMIFLIYFGFYRLYSRNICNLMFWLREVTIWARVCIKISKPWGMLGCRIYKQAFNNSIYIKFHSYDFNKAQNNLPFVNRILLIITSFVPT